MTLRFWVVLLCISLGCGPAGAAEPPPTEQAAFALLKDGKRQEALHAFEAVIAANPIDPSRALFAASMIDLEDGKWRSARPYARQLVKLRPSAMQAWEVLIQVDQAANDLADRNAAIRSLYQAWRSALDPATQQRVTFARDRIFGPKRTVVAHETLEPGGDDSIRFAFRPVDQVADPQHIIVVRSDEETTQRWRDSGSVPYSTIVYHLDTVARRPGGRQEARPYAFYLEPPDYDTIRPIVVGILNGEAKPLSGEPDPYWTGGE